MRNRRARLFGDQKPVRRPEKRMISLKSDHRQMGHALQGATIRFANQPRKAKTTERPRIREGHRLKSTHLCAVFERDVPELVGIGKAPLA
jgi:hypothetical protein